MACGPKLIDAVGKIINPTVGLTTDEIVVLLDGSTPIHPIPSKRAIRYAISHLVKQGRAKRDRPLGPVFAVPNYGEAQP
jgi:hypothetical protein